MRPAAITLAVVAVVISDAAPRAAEMLSAAHASIRAADAGRHVATLADDAFEGREGLGGGNTDRARTVPAALAFFTGASQYQSPVTAIAAASVVVTIPVVLLVACFQRRIVAGLTAGAVKG